MTKTAAPAPAAKKPSRHKGRKPGSTALTLSQKAEAVALWRSGDATLEFLSKKFGKRPETFSRLFKRLGVEKGSAAKAAAAKIEAKLAEHTLNDAEETLKRIREVKDNHYKMAKGLAQLVWAEIVRARSAELKIEGLKETMATLKLAGEVISNSRKELYAILNVEESDKRGELDELPELTVRELTQNEVDQLRTSVSEEELMMGDAGAGMLDVESP